MTAPFRPALRTALRPAVLAMLVAAGVPQGAQAMQAEDAAATAPHVDLRLNGLDLTTPEGVITARHQVANAARAVCQSTIDPDGFHLKYSACVLNARNLGNQQLEGLRQQAMAKAQVQANLKLAMQNASPKK